VWLSPEPHAVAIDPDRGTNGRGLAVVTCTNSNGASSPSGALDAVDLAHYAGQIPRQLRLPSSPLPDGCVFDPSVSPALFYSVSTQGTLITAFNPDTGATQTIKVGIIPTPCLQFPDGTILTVDR